MDNPYYALGQFTAVAYIVGFVVYLWLFPHCCGMIALNKGYPQGAAQFMGLLFGIVALIYYAGLPDKKSQDMLTRIAGLMPYWSEEHKRHYDNLRAE